MKILISSKNYQDEVVIDERFGRCEFYLIHETPIEKGVKIINTASEGLHGAGPKAAQIAIDHHVDAIITGNLGLKALAVIKETSIKAYYNQGSSIEKNIDLLMAGLLKEIDTPGPSNQGK